jgi:hypothetical protein
MTLRRLCLTVLFLALTVSVANAYTLVMRDKRRVEIPNQFTVTESTLTYEAGSGIQITIQLSSIDIPATEWINREQKGSFMLRASTTPQVVNSAETRPAAARSITNKDLESYRQKRIHSELAYEKRRRQLGLPSAEAQRLESAAIVERTRAQLLSVRSREEESEQYWRGLASSLRTDLASNQAQIEFVRRRLEQLPPSGSLGGFTTTSPFGAPVLNFPFQNPLTPNVFSSSQVTSGFAINIGTNTLGNRRFPYGNNRGRRYQRGRFGPMFGQNVFGLPYQTPDYSYERAELVNQLNELEMNRAALVVRWRELEEEARRAGAYPGWLRP